MTKTCIICKKDIYEEAAKRDWQSYIMYQSIQLRIDKNRDIPIYSTQIHYVCSTCPRRNRVNWVQFIHQGEEVRE